ncbi:hypothetical protein INS49_007806 [Diaporthe citri]|uniref:uncharacterized protein n=1 Tax=Diaporthe citri TaxID=83186 RepID=UPI001C7E8156|nr:uncharacterized protein INS49_007806 [Diaporthe citri]KAG6362713.1 hypothetical protein INS49_007806 [Diaporthe citri]
MDEDDGPKDGGTGKIGFRPSTDAIACQTPSQSGIPAWMLARNNSVHAPVFGQPSARKSEPKASPPPQKPSPSVGLDALNDNQALALLLKNETVGGLLQNAFNARVEEHQQKLVRAYNQRLVELEEYTRSWRDATKELWSALSEGTLKPNNDQRETLLWKGPQEAGSRFDPDLPSAPQEVVEKEVDADGRVACISIKVASSSQSTSHFNRQEWITSNGCSKKNFKSLGHKIRSFMKIKHDPRLLFRDKHDVGKIECRPFTAVTSTTRNLHKDDVIIEMTPSNVALMGKAFCYLKDTNDRLLPQRNTDPGADFTAAELSFLYDRFSQEPTKRHIDVVSDKFGTKKVNSSLFAADADISVIPKRLLIARPCYDTSGSINGVTFFDVGSDTHTTRQDKGPVAEVSKKACDDLHEKLVKHYRNSWPSKKKNKTLIQSVSLPLKYSNNKEVYDGNRVIGAEFFDTASGARKARVSTDIVLTEDTVTLMDIGYLLERVILEGMLPVIKQNHTTSSPVSIEIPHSKSQVSWPQMSPSEVSEQSGKTVSVARSFPKTCVALHDMGLEQQDISAVLKSLASPQPSLFQRTLALSAGLKELRDQTCHDNPDSQTQNQWLAIGGELEDVRSPSPSLEQDSPTDTQPQVHGAQAEVFPFGLTDQRILEDFSGDSEDSDLVMLDGQPKSITFRRREKHLLSAVDQEVQMAKRPKLSTPEIFTEVGEQLPQSLHRGKRDSVEAFNPLPPPSAITIGELHKLREQLRRLGNRLQDSVDRGEESTVGGEIEEIEKLRITIERFGGVLEAQRETEERQEMRKEGKTLELSDLADSYIPRFIRRRDSCPRNLRSA